MSPTESAYLAKHGPARHAATARKVDLCLRLSDRPCTGNGCDEGRPCGRHRRIPAVVSRYLRMKGER